MDLPTLHAGLANALLMFSAIMGLWGLLSAARRAPLGGDYWGAVIIGEILAIVEGTLGALMLVEGLAPARWIHILYGVVAVISWPGAYAFMYRRDAPALGARGQALVFGVLGLFLAGIALRAMGTAR